MTVNQDEIHNFGLNQVEKARLIEEITYYKRRLATIGYTGDCAYEKRLSTIYINTITRCEEKLLQYQK